jgi:hypothetical protein
LIPKQLRWILDQCWDELRRYQRAQSSKTALAGRILAAAANSERDPKADMCGATGHVGFGPKADMQKAKLVHEELLNFTRVDFLIAQSFKPNAGSVETQ